MNKIATNLKILRNIEKAMSSNLQDSIEHELLNVLLDIKNIEDMQIKELKIITISLNEKIMKHIFRFREERDNRYKEAKNLNKSIVPIKGDE